MADLRKEKYKSRTLDIQMAMTTFDEVNQGYDEITAVSEAKRCLSCPHFPCVKGCPLNNHIPDFIKFVASGDFIKAYHVLEETTSLSSVCGRVCPHEKQCEGHCIRGKSGEPVSIGNLERFVGEYYLAHKQKATASPIQNQKIAIIGGGPAGLHCAYTLLKLGYQVTIFEKNEVLGGALMYAIPSFRLPGDIVQKEIQKIFDLGAEVNLNIEIKDPLDLLKQGYDDVFIACGANKSKRLDIKGEELDGVIPAELFLHQFNRIQKVGLEGDFPLKNANKVLVVGGGNVAIDSARTLKRLGKQVIIIYRRTKEEMPAYDFEIQEALDEGVEIMYLVNPKEMIKCGKSNKVILTRNELGMADSSGRRRPIEIPNSDFVIEDVDAIIAAISASPNSEVCKNIIDLGSWGQVLIDDNCRTSIKHIYAGGDIVNGPLTVTSAMRQGFVAALAIHNSYKTKKS